MIAYLLLFVGLLLVFLEFYLPGAVMGATGAVLIILSIVMYSTSGVSVYAVLIFFSVSVVLLIGVIQFALWSIRRTGKAKTIFLDSDQEGYRSSRYEQELVGKKGRCHTHLRPGGYVLIDKKKYAAISVSGFLDKQDEIEVLEIEGETLKVRKV